MKCFPEQIQRFMEDRQCEPEQFDGRIIFMSMFNDFVWGEKGNAENCESDSRAVANYAGRFPCGHWSLWRLGNHSSNVPCFQCPWKRGIKKQRREQCLRSSSRSVQGIVQRYHGFGETWSTWSFGYDFFTERPTADPRTDEERRGKIVARIWAKNRTTTDNQKFSKLCSYGGLKTVERGHYFVTLDTAKGPSGMVHLCRGYTLLETIRELEREAGFVGIRTLAQS